MLYSESPTSMRQICAARLLFCSTDGPARSRIPVKDRDFCFHVPGQGGEASRPVNSRRSHVGTSLLVSGETLSCYDGARLSQHVSFLELRDFSGSLPKPGAASYPAPSRTLCSRCSISLSLQA